MVSMMLSCKKKKKKTPKKPHVIKPIMFFFLCVILDFIANTELLISHFQTYSGDILMK